MLSPIISYAGNWQYDGTDWRYYDTAKQFKDSQWFQDEDGCWYYLDSEGNMMIDAVTPDGYTEGKDGAWVVKIPQIDLYSHIAPDETCNNNASKKGEPIFQVKTDKPLIALSFDSGSNLAYTDQILEILDKHHIRSTFFLTKEWMENHEADVRKIYDGDHEIGNHSVNHPDFTKLTVNQMNAQILLPFQKLYDRWPGDSSRFKGITL